jgi:hypothetical protein
MSKCLLQLYETKCINGLIGTVDNVPQPFDAYLVSRKTKLLQLLKMLHCQIFLAVSLSASNPTVLIIWFGSQNCFQLDSTNGTLDFSYF